MALAVNIRFDFIDDKGKTSFTKVRVPTGYTIANYVEFAQGAAQVLADMSNAQITNVSLTFGLDLSGQGLRTVASTVSDIYQKIRFQWTTALAGFQAMFSVPATSESKIVTGSDAVDEVDVDVAAFITAVEDGIVVTGGTMNFVDSRGNDITALQFGREFHRASA